jgi:hypothetical protein
MQRRCRPADAPGGPGAASWCSRCAASQSWAHAWISRRWLVSEPSSADEQALLQQSGPACPDAGADYASLLELTAWRLVDSMDVTAELARCLDVLLEAYQAQRAELVELLGERDFAERLVRRHSTRSAVARGLLRREIFVAVS